MALYNIIKQDSEKNTHARILLQEIDKFAEDHKDEIFNHGEITYIVLRNISDGLIHNIQKDYAEYYELKALSRSYLEFNRIYIKAIDDDVPELKL